MIEGRVMGLDIGDVRTGVALSDPLGIIAQAHTVIDANPPQRAIDTLRKIVEDHGVTHIVAGLPLNQRGERGPQAEKVQSFVDLLKAAVPVEVSTIDERFTTAGAQRSLLQAGMRRKGRKQVIDKVAAQQILQTYLDRRKHMGASQSP
ncbi:MAG: Holliday junction resolvase RuvX [Candidatus Hydrogenedentes bacterium]|nr:Holliday junction resolvase RuvX [Candidatus Hydrogenedentota bacterium]